MIQKATLKKLLASAVLPTPLREKFLRTIDRCSDEQLFLLEKALLQHQEGQKKILKEAVSKNPKAYLSKLSRIESQNLRDEEHFFRGLDQTSAEDNLAKSLNA